MNQVLLLNIQIFSNQRDSKQSFCLGGRHYSQMINRKVFEKANPKTQKLFNFPRGTCSIGGRGKSQMFTK